MRDTLQSPRETALPPIISLFAKRPPHFPVPLGDPRAVARRRGQGRPSAGACALPLTGASTAALSRQSGSGWCHRAVLLMLIGTMTAGVPGTASPAHAEPVAVHPDAPPYADDVAEAARRFGIPGAWIDAVIRVESDGDRRSVSSKGAMGLMQLMPENWAEMRARLGLGSDPFDPHDNILAGTALLRDLHDRYGAPGFLSAYNAGPGRYEDYRDRHRPLPAETVAYVARLGPLMVGDVTAIGAGIAMIDPFAWANAPLFVGHARGSDSVLPAAARPSPDGTPPPIRVSDLSAIAPQSDGLFIPLATRVSAP